MRKLPLRLILVGKAASGKDYLRDAFTRAGYKPDISVTTRPMRSNEQEGVSYNFITEDVYEKLVEENKLYEHVRFNGWGYGTLKESWENSDVFIMTPSGIEHIDPSELKDCFIVYFDIDEQIRRERLQQRSDADSVERRIIADNKDFENFQNYDAKISNPDFIADKVVTNTLLLIRFYAQQRNLLTTTNYESL